MIVTHKVDDNIYTIYLEGDFVLDAVSDVQRYIDQILETATIKRIVLNFKKVDTVDSSGIGLTVSLFKNLQKQNADLVLCELTEYVQEAYMITGLDSVFKIVKTIEESKEL